MVYSSWIFMESLRVEIDLNNGFSMGKFSVSNHFN